MPSFDVVSELNWVEVANAIDQANKEISTRFDFKGSDSRVEWSKPKATVFADDDFKLEQATELFHGKLSKRGIDLRSLKAGEVEKISGGKVKRSITMISGIEQEVAKKIIAKIKEQKLKVQASIQGESVRVSGAKKDLLQEVIAFLRTEIKEVPLQFNNFRD